MPYIKPEALQEARRIDLLTWLQANEPGNLEHISGNNYCTREHDSLKISNGKWSWFSRGIGGVSALDYLIKVRGIALPQAVEMIVGSGTVSYGYGDINREPVKKEPRKLLIPDLEPYPVRVWNYLRRRGIRDEVIEYCVHHSLLFETRKYHNILFVGYDENGQARYGALRGTLSAYKGEVTGSDKHYSFTICDDPASHEVHLFEAAIDLLSYVSLMIMDGKDWKKDAYVSMAGAFITKHKETVPVALQTFLELHSNVSVIHLHLDNDEVGRGATAGIMEGIGTKYLVLDEPPERGKDVNDQLMARVRKNRRKEVPER